MNWAVIYRFSWALIFAVCVFSAVCVFMPQCTRIRELQRKRSRIEIENRQLEGLTAELREKQERFDTNGDFVVRTARETGMVMPHETVYRMTNSQELVTVELPR